MAAVGIFSSLAGEVLARCDILAAISEVPGTITRPFLCPATHQVHECLKDWMAGAGMTVRRDAAGNLIGHYPAALRHESATSPAAGPQHRPAQVLLIGSHVDTVPNAGRYDGLLGVLLGVAAVAGLGGKRLPFAVEVIGFSEEEGIRYRSPYLGSRAVCGTFDVALLEHADVAGISLRQAFHDFGLDASRLGEAVYPAGKILGYLEAHIEQGPILDSRDLPLGIVIAIVGQSRLQLRFEGKAGHAGTLPMELRQDALAAAAEFILDVERLARATADLRDGRHPWRCPGRHQRRSRFGQVEPGRAPSPRHGPRTGGDDLDRASGGERRAARSCFSCRPGEPSSRRADGRAAYEGAGGLRHRGRPRALANGQRRRA